MINKKKLREICLPLLQVRSLDEAIEVLDIFLEYMFLIIRDHHDDEVYNRADADAVMINHMMFTKVTHLRKLLDGVDFQSNIDGSRMNPIIDPTIVASLIRNIYETVCLFHLIYILPTNKEQKLIVYGLWVISGLKYRQRFSSIATQPDSIRKLDDEAKQIESFKNEIENFSLYKTLSSDNKKKIQEKIRQKDYKIFFDNNNVNFTDWQGISSKFDLKHGLFENIYTYFSLYSHPSFVAVFQFENMFGKDTAAFIELTSTSLKYCIALLSIFVADYIKLFPNTLITYNKLDAVSQIIMNYQNVLMRGEEFSINDMWKELN